MRDRFRTITENVNIECTFAYLGMSVTIDRERKSVKLSMTKYVDDVLENSLTSGCSKTPALSDLFAIDEESPLLGLEQAKEFHSMIARLLYLAKRTRPDILTSIAFLATRVRAPTVQDGEKLDRVMRYLRGTKELTLSMRADAKDPLILKCYVDASHAVHSKDGRSQTGLFVTLGEGPIFYRSAKQKLDSKRST